MPQAACRARLDPHGGPPARGPTVAGPAYPRPGPARDFVTLHPHLGPTPANVTGPAYPRGPERPGTSRLDPARHKQAWPGPAYSRPGPTRDFVTLHPHLGLTSPLPSRGPPSAACFREPAK